MIYILKNKYVTCSESENNDIYLKSSIIVNYNENYDIFINLKLLGASNYEEFNTILKKSLGTDEGIPGPYIFNNNTIYYQKYNDNTQNLYENYIDYIKYNDGKYINSLDDLKVNDVENDGSGSGSGTIDNESGAPGIPELPKIPGTAPGAPPAAPGIPELPKIPGTAPGAPPAAPGTTGGDTSENPVNQLPQNIINYKRGDTNFGIIFKVIMLILSTIGLALSGYIILKVRKNTKKVEVNNSGVLEDLCEKSGNDIEACKEVRAE